MIEYGLDTLFDSYNRKARLYPALITLSPIIWSASLLIPNYSLDITKIATALLIICFLFLLANITRSFGKFVEEKLLNEWGAWPTTIMLRHRDHRIDTLTKSRYHAALSAICDGIQFPTAIEEQKSPNIADECYRTAINQLIELRRGPQYKILNDENTSYGFRRNLLGLKPFALMISFMAASITGFAWWVSIPEETSFDSVIAAVRNAPVLPIFVIVDTMYFFLFILVIRKTFVLQAAYEYSAALLKTLDRSKSK